MSPNTDVFIIYMLFITLRWHLRWVLGKRTPLLLCNVRGINHHGGSAALAGLYVHSLLCWLCTNGSKCLSPEGGETAANVSVAPALHGDLRFTSTFPSLFLTKSTSVGRTNLFFRSNKAAVGLKPHLCSVNTAGQLCKRKSPRQIIYYLRWPMWSNKLDCHLHGHFS